MDELVLDTDDYNQLIENLQTQGAASTLQLAQALLQIDAATAQLLVDTLSQQQEAEPEQPPPACSGAGYCGDSCNQYAASQHCFSAAP